MVLNGATPRSLTFFTSFVTDDHLESFVTPDPISSEDTT